MSGIDLKNALPSRLETERLTLRPPMRGDALALVEQANNYKVARMLKRMPHPYGRADAIGFIEVVAQRESERAYIVCSKRGTLVGVASFMFADGYPPEIGYWFGESFWGRGYASEVVAAMLVAARATGHFPVICAQVLAHNYASARVLEKAGFGRTHTSVDAVGNNRGKSVIHFRLETVEEAA